jgi:NAD(P)-dependent dehydrogenase (short-subunit alcohol dehydrogenase family)
VARLFAEVDRQLSGLDVLVNNAGIAGPTGGIARELKVRK